MKYNLVKIGKIIRHERRKEIKISQEEACRKLLISRNRLSNIETGKEKGQPDIRLLFDLCELFNCDAGYLLGEYPLKTGRNTDINKETGLSENAINQLSLMLYQGESIYIDELSHVIENDKIHELLHRIRSLKLLKEAIKNGAVLEDKSLPDVSEYKISQLFISIIQDITN